MLGLMQNWPLTVDKLLTHAATWHEDTKVVSLSVEGTIVRTTYGELHHHAKRLTNALTGLGIRPGNRVATLAWNTARHAEALYGITGTATVCHTLTPRLFFDQ